MNPVLSSLNWDPPLAQFAKATGLAVSLLDASGKPCSGPHTPTPFTARLAEAGAWAEAGPCHRAEVEAARQAAHTGRTEVAKALEHLSLLALPVPLDGRVAGTLVAGWCFDFYPDPLVGDRLARLLGLPFPELWGLLRQQVPVSADKLGVYADLLRTLAEALVRQLAGARADQETARTLRILNQSAHALTGATRAEAIGAAAIDAVLDLTRSRAARLRVLDDTGSWVTAAVRGPWDDGLAPPADPAASRIGSLRIPALGADGVTLGWIEAQRDDAFPDTANLPELSALAAQVAVALEKAGLIDALERERAALRHALEELARANRLKDEFLSTLSHELRTPLNAILGWAQLLRSQALDPPGQQRAVETIERNAWAQARLVDDLLDTARIASGKLHLDIRPLDLLQVLDAALETVRPAARSKSIRLHRRVGDRVLPYQGDAQRLQQVFWNLLSNAVKFTPQGGEVTVSAAVKGAGLRVTVTDTGPGIPAALLPRIFERFSQADGSAARSFGGLGLGLAIARHVVELHGGTIGVESPGPGKGATFWVVLPGNGALVAEPPDPAQDAAAAPSLVGRRVLVVEDDADTLGLLVRTLEARGAELRTATTAAEGLAIVRDWRPDLLISDLGLPEEDGYSLIRRLRRLPADQGGALPALALSALARDADRQAALAAGFQAHLGKPVELARLLAAVADLAGPVPAETPPCRVLVVDDYRDAARMLAQMLELFGHQTRTAHDGAEALAVAAEFRPRVVLLDLGLPDLDGREVARRLRREAAARGQPLSLIAQTGRSLRDLPEGAVEFDHYLVKPLDVERLQAILREVLEGGGPEGRS